MRIPNTGLALSGLATTLTFVLTAVALMACSGSPGTSDPLDLLHDETVGIWVYDIGAINSDPEAQIFEDVIEEYWERTIEPIGILMSEADSLTVGAMEIGGYMVIQGDLDFRHIRENLEEQDYEDDEYRGFELWSGGNLRNASSMVLLEGDAIVIAGTDDYVRGIVRNLSRGESAREGEHEATVRALDRAGDSWVKFVIARCGPALRGCEASGEAYSGGDRYEVRVQQIVMFRDERSAEANLDDVDDLFDDPDLDDYSIRVDGEFVVAEGAMDEEDMADGLDMEYGILTRE